MLTKIELFVTSETEWTKQITRVQEAESLCGLVRATLMLLQYLGKCLLEGELRRRDEKCKPTHPCPHCGSRLESKGLVPRRVTTLLGKIKINRRVYRCPKGCKGTHIALLDRELGLEAHQQTSWEVKYLGTLLCLFVPYALSSQLLNQLTGLKIHESSLWRWVQEMGKKASQVWQKRLETAEVPIESMSPEIAQLVMVMAADGVMVPFRPETGTPKGKTRWQEIKVAVIARLQSLTTAAGKRQTRLVQRRLVAVLGDVDALKQRLSWEAKHQGIETAPTVVWLSDGGVGFWRLFRECFSRWAVGILDFYHAASHLSKAAHAYLFDDNEGAQLCFEAWRHLLRHGKHLQVLSSLTRLVHSVHLPQPQMRSLIQVQDYFSSHRPHLAYAQFESEHFPLGSGLVESACKWLIQQRFKGVGMRWSHDGFENLLYLRLEWVNHRFDSLFPPFVSLPPQT